MAKVVLVDNFDREYIEDILLEENLTDEDAEAKAKEYNDKHPSGWNWFARAVDNDYHLWRGIEELI